MNHLRSTMLARSLALVLLLAAPLLPASPSPPAWKHLSSRTGGLPEPNGGRLQTAVIVFDADGDGLNDFALAERTQRPGVIGMRRFRPRLGRVRD